MLVLFETPAGYAIFKIADDKSLKNVEEVATAFETPKSAQKL